MNNVVVYSCASILFPILAMYVLTTCEKRPQKRLGEQADELTRKLEHSRRKT